MGLSLKQKRTPDPLALTRRCTLTLRLACKEPVTLPCWNQWHGIDSQQVKFCLTMAGDLSSVLVTQSSKVLVSQHDRLSGQTQEAWSSEVWCKNGLHPEKAGYVLALSTPSPREGTPFVVLAALESAFWSLDTADQTKGQTLDKPPMNQLIKKS